MQELAVEVKNLSFGYKNKPVLHDISFSLEKGSRCLLVGANGAGKTTLLKVLAGKCMHEREAVQVLGFPAFYCTPTTITYLGPEWRQSFSTVGVTVGEMLRAHTKANDCNRRKFLMQLLGVEMDWWTNELSEGELRRVQILLGLLEPFDLLLLDEVTIDLDCVMRTELLEFLKQESEAGATIVYVTHIFDGLDGWPTQIARCSHGKLNMVDPNTIEPYPGTLVSPLFLTVVKWIREDLGQKSDRVVQLRQTYKTEHE